MEGTSHISSSLAAGGVDEEDCLRDEFLEACYLKLAYVYLCVSEPLLALDSIRTALRRIKSFSASGRCVCFNTDICFYY